MKKKNGKNQKEAVHHRSKYVDHSLRFVDWVNRLGIERTWFGRMAFMLEQRFQLRRFALLFLFSIVLAFSMSFELDIAYSGYKEGDVASTEIRSPIMFEMEDSQATAAKRIAAEDGIPPVFDYDRDAYEKQVAQVYEAFRMMRGRLPKGGWSKKQSEREEDIKDFLKHKGAFEESLGNATVSNRLFEWLSEKRFSIRLENTLIRTLARFSSLKVVPDLKPLQQSGQEQVIVRVIEKNGGGEEFTEKISLIDDIFSLKKRVEVVGSQKFSTHNRRNLESLVEALLVPNLTLNQQETTERRQRAREAVPAVILSIKANQVIVGDGAVVQDNHLRILEEISRRQASHRKDVVGLFLAALFVSLILVFFSYLRRFTLNQVKVPTKDFMVMGLVTLIMVVISKFSYFVYIEAIQERVGSFVPEAAFLYMIPVAAGSMLVGLLIASGEVVWLFTAFLAVTLSIMVGFNFEFLVYAIVGGIAGARGVHGCKKRNDIYFAGVRVGIINVIVVGLMTLTLHYEQHGDGLWKMVMWNMIAGLGSGVLSSFIAMMLVPLLETTFNYTTDVKLLELSNLNHPLLRDMIVKAPGTYHHSLVVGNMVEAAAEAIGGNPLLAKVSSYYHDIGKMEHSNYFIENQKQGYNPHDHLSPFMSKTILIAHVKDGVELGMKYKLGKPIIDVILQHHGTTLISFFYNRAKQAEDVDIDEIEEDEFRYPGPRPQFREAALCMLADSIEAAARSLDEPNPMRLKNIVKNIIHRKFMDGQLSECNLTLKDLSEIENSFYQILLGIYHQRVDYPKAAGGGASESPDKTNVRSL